MVLSEPRAAKVEVRAAPDGGDVALSGEFDSSVIATLSHEALGDDPVACTAESVTRQAAEDGDDRRVADEIGIRYVEVLVSEFDNPAFVASDVDRHDHGRTMRLGGDVRPRSRPRIRDGL